MQELKKKELMELNGGFIILPGLLPLACYVPFFQPMAVAAFAMK